MNTDLLSLFTDWKAVIKKNNSALADFFTLDGAFPGYHSAPCKVLIIGRESRFAPSRDRIADDQAWFKKLSPRDTLGAYWNRVISLVYGIWNQGRLSYSALPAPAEILTDMVKNNSYGFAIMNISKYLNTADDSGTSNFNLINQFLEDSELDRRNFIQEEIAILSPDVIITANLWDCGIKKTYLHKIFPQSLLGPLCFDSENKNASLQDFHLNGKTIKLVDIYHFSAAGSTQNKFYNPVMELLF